MIRDVVDTLFKLFIIRLGSMIVIFINNELMLAGNRDLLAE